MLAVLLEDPSPGLRVHMGHLQLPAAPVSEDLMPLCGSAETHTHTDTHTYTHTRVGGQWLQFEMVSEIQQYEDQDHQSVFSGKPGQEERIKIN